jgi:hypothetical protein
VRPIWHQRADRVQAHILVCFLAFVLTKSLEMWQQRAGLEPRTILEELARIQSHDLVLPTSTHGQIRLRCVTQPDPAQAALLTVIRMRVLRYRHAPRAELLVLVAATRGDRLDGYNHWGYLRVEGGNNGRASCGRFTSALR